MGLLDPPRQQQVGGLLGAAPQKAGFADYALATLAGGVGGAAGLGLQQRQGQRQYAAQSERLAQLGQMAQQAGLTKEEVFSLNLDPAKALEMLTNRTKPQNVNGGDSLYVGGQFKTAPKVGVQDGYGYTQTPEAITWGAQRGQTHQEDQAAKRDQQSYVAAMTPEGFLPQTDQTGNVTGANLIPEYGKFALQKAATGATRVTVPVTLPAQNAFADQLAKNYANRLDTAQTNSDTARDSLSILGNAKAALKGGAITGAAAGPRLQGARLLSLAGNRNAKSAVENTQTFESVMGGQVLAIAKQLGSGSGISNADRDFAAKVAGGSINLDEGTISRLIDIQQTQAKNTIQRGQSMGAEAFGSVPSAQGLPMSTFGGGARGASLQVPRGGGQPADPLGIR